jgi:hypothetical protein
MASEADTDASSAPPEQPDDSEEAAAALASAAATTAAGENNGDGATATTPTLANSPASKTSTWWKCFKLFDLKARPLKKELAQCSHRAAQANVWSLAYGLAQHMKGKHHGDVVRDLFRQKLLKRQPVTD